MKNRSYLVIAASLNFFIALVHIIAIFIGAPAYEFLDAPELAFYAEMGSSLPVWITLGVTFFFILFGIYGFFGAGSKIKLPMQSLILKGIGIIYLLRSLVIFWELYLKFTNSPYFSLKEIGFSLFALLIGALYLIGSRSNSRLSQA